MPTFLRTGMFRILALDQSTKCTGWAVISSDGIESYGHITVNDKEDVMKRLQDMYKEIKKLIDIQKPSFVVFEGTQYQNNAGAFGSLSRLQGLIMAILIEYNISFFIIEPTSWKSFCKISGRKRAEQKANTKIFVAEKYNLNVSEDEADAIGIATWGINKINNI